MIRIDPVSIARSGWIVFCVACALLLPSAAQAGCPGFWDLTGDWKLAQSNGYRIVLEDVQQTGTTITGRALYESENDRTTAWVHLKNGTFDGKTLSFVVDWPASTKNPPGVQGFYKGDIDDEGYLKGYSEDKTHPGSALAGWSSNHVAICKAEPEPSATTPPSQAELPPNKPVKAIGKSKSTVTQPYNAKITTDLGNGEIEYQYPLVKTSSGEEAWLDWCRVWANDCGKGAADVFCRQAGHQAAVRFVRRDNAGKTWVIDDKKECAPDCTSFKSIVCTKVVAANTGGGGAEYATAISPTTIYVAPGGAAFKDANGDDAAMTAGSKALVLEKRTNPAWYKLQTKPVGWVWGEDVTLGP